MFEHQNLLGDQHFKRQEKDFLVVVLNGCLEDNEVVDDSYLLEGFHLDHVVTNLWFFL